MASNKLILAGALVAAALGISVKDEVRLPWEDSAAAPVRMPAIRTLGYLPAAALPDSRTIAPAPPQPGSPGMQRDEQARSAALLGPASPRYKQAAIDTALPTAATARTFACALGIEISAEQTPRLYTLLSRIILDIRASAYAAKNLYNRPRPFVVHNTRTCVPDSEAMLKDDGSYPSGQAAIGRAYARILANLLPERGPALMDRADSFARSRMICEVNWQSDLDAGHRLGDAVVASILKQKAFQADLEAARAEVAQGSAFRTAPSVDCQMEARALASR